MPENSLPFVIIPVFAVVFGLFWSFIVFVVAHIGGWARLAKAYPATGKPEGRSWNWRSMRIGLFFNYRNSVNVTLSDAGLYMRPILLFRIGHKPILLPWKAISDAQRRDLWFATTITLAVPLTGNGNERRLSFYGKTFVEAMEGHLKRNGNALHR
ncbi:hypothetical protein FMN63_22445 [Stappia sp. BW2]|uniref:hypothetical protein n=1 Tax=Stappia sp. BW2 TaxID=2592622 RepID=UPI0011DE6F20|nr:hypothetical protein [Stappia sp. BW2]TYC65188.1 hypothetical protein FMN63_22445 [Stappia sp. BW2]